MIENFGSASEMADWGCSYEELGLRSTSAARDAVAVGLRAQRPSPTTAHGTNISCFVGLTHMWGYTHGTLTDYVCSVHGVVGVPALATRRAPARAPWSTPPRSRPRRR